MRKTGTTTRAVNHYIQKMIDNPGSTYKIVDHFDDVHNNSILIKRIEHRLQSEYPNMIDVSHSMDNYGKSSKGVNTMSVRYSPYVLLNKDIFAGRFVDKIIEGIFNHRNTQVDVYPYIKETYYENTKLGYPTINGDFLSKVFDFVRDRLRYEHKIDPTKLLSIDYSLEKDNEYIILTLYTNECLDNLFSLNKTKTRIDDMGMFSNVGVYKVDSVKVDNFDEYVSDCLTDCVNTSTRTNKLTRDIVSSIDDLSGCITTVKDSISTFAVNTNACIDVIDELKKEIDELKNKDKYKMPDNEIQINKMNMFK